MLLDNIITSLIKENKIETVKKLLYYFAQSINKARDLIEAVKLERKNIKEKNDKSGRYSKIVSFIKDKLIQDIYQKTKLKNVSNFYKINFQIELADLEKNYSEKLLPKISDLITGLLFFESILNVDLRYYEGKISTTLAALNKGVPVELNLKIDLLDLYLMYFIDISKLKDYVEEYKLINKNRSDEKDTAKHSENYSKRGEETQKSVGERTESEDTKIKKEQDNVKETFFTKVSPDIKETSTKDKSEISRVGIESDVELKKRLSGDIDVSGITEPKQDEFIKAIIKRERERQKFFGISKKAERIYGRRAILKVDDLNESYKGAETKSSLKQKQGDKKETEKTTETDSIKKILQFIVENNQKSLNVIKNIVDDIKRNKRKQEEKAKTQEDSGSQYIYEGALKQNKVLDKGQKKRRIARKKKSDRSKKILKLRQEKDKAEKTLDKVSLYVSKLISKNDMMTASNIVDKVRNIIVRGYSKDTVLFKEKRGIAKLIDNVLDKIGGVSVRMLRGLGFVQDNAVLKGIANRLRHFINLGIKLPKPIDKVVRYLSNITYNSFLDKTIKVIKGKIPTQKDKKKFESFTKKLNEKIKQNKDFYSNNYIGRYIGLSLLKAVTETYPNTEERDNLVNKLSKYITGIELAKLMRQKGKKVLSGESKEKSDEAGAKHDTKINIKTKTVQGPKESDINSDLNRRERKGSAEYNKDKKAGKTARGSLLDNIYDSLKNTKIFRQIEEVKNFLKNIKDTREKFLKGEASTTEKESKEEDTASLELKLTSKESTEVKTIKAKSIEAESIQVEKINGESVEDLLDTNKKTKKFDAGGKIKKTDLKRNVKRIGELFYDKRKKRKTNKKAAPQEEEDDLLSESLMLDTAINESIAEILEGKGEGEEDGGLGLSNLTKAIQPSSDPDTLVKGGLQSADKSLKNIKTKLSGLSKIKRRLGGAISKIKGIGSKLGSFVSKAAGGIAAKIGGKALSRLAGGPLGIILLIGDLTQLAYKIYQFYKALVPDVTIYYDNKVKDKMVDAQTRSQLAKEATKNSLTITNIKGEAGRAYIGDQQKFKDEGAIRAVGAAPAKPISYNRPSTNPDQTPNPYSNLSITSTKNDGGNNFSAQIQELQQVLNTVDDNVRMVAAGQWADGVKVNQHLIESARIEKALEGSSVNTFPTPTLTTP